jgi:N-acetylmuramoyl-L-alanine amidase
VNICLDPGHGRKNGKATGAQAHGVVEDDWALNFAERVGHYLRAAGQAVVFTRDTAAFVALGDRGKTAKRAKCDLFLSIHVNAGPPSAHGCEAYFAAGDKRGQALGAKLCTVLWTHGQLHPRGVKQDNQSQHTSLRVLRDTYRAMPATLLEVGFLTNDVDARMLLDKQWVETLAAHLAEAIVEP